jgi:myo-inositol-1(or 4)-monophosphatase
MSHEPIDIEAIISAAKAGGEILRTYFGQVLEITQKSNLADVRTKADLESEAAVIAALTTSFPTYNIFSEESGVIHRNSEYTFIIDPLDGTNNFVLGIPIFSVSIGLMHHDTIIAGVIYLPLVDQTYYAQKGEGAFLNGNPIHVSTVTDLNNLTITHACNYHTTFESLSQLFKTLFAIEHKRVISQWCPTFDFCLLASGKADCMINEGTELYDFSAGKLIALEAGAYITTFTNEAPVNDRETVFIMSNGAPTVHDHLINAVNAK